MTTQSTQMLVQKPLTLVGEDVDVVQWALEETIRACEQKAKDRDDAAWRAQANELKELLGRIQLHMGTGRSLYFHPEVTE